MKEFTSLSLFENHSKALRATLSALQEKMSSLEASQKRASLVLSYIDDAVLLIDFQGIILECNQAALHLFQIESHELLFQPFWDHFEDHFFGFSMKELLEKKREKKHLILSLIHGKQRKQVEVTTRIIPSMGLIVSLRDRSELERLEKSLKENEQLRALGEMAATLAHEIRNPLSGIKGFAHLLLLDCHERPKEKKMIEAILEGSDLLNNLVTHVLDYAKPCALNFASVSLQSILAKQLSYLGLKERKRIELIAPREIILSVDEVHFGRALLNLIQNGLEASSAKKKVTIIGQEKKVIIQDQGVGIAPEHIEKICTPFFTTKAKGTGLGLAEVHKIIHAHGFTYKIESSDMGTTVTIFCTTKKEGIDDCHQRNTDC